MSSKCRFIKHILLVQKDDDDDNNKEYNYTKTVDSFWRALISNSNSEYPVLFTDAPPALRAKFA